MKTYRLISALCVITMSLGAAVTGAQPANAAPLHISGIEPPAPAVTQINHRGWHRRGRGHHHWRHRNDNWVPPAAFALGAIIGGAIATAPPRYYRDRYYTRPAHRGHVYRGSAHTRWCYNRYRSYRAWDNTFQPYHGPRRQCWSPYN